MTDKQPNLDPKVQEIIDRAKVKAAEKPREDREELHAGIGLWTGACLIFGLFFWIMSWDFWIPVGFAAFSWLIIIIEVMVGPEDRPTKPRKEKEVRRINKR